MTVEEAEAQASRMPSVERVRELLSYDPDNGEFRWKRGGGRGGGVNIGELAGYLRRDGYVVIKIGGRGYFAHRLAWVIATGEWPNKEIDHVDCNPSNNRFDNLREASRVQNNANVRRLSRNSSGHKGVYHRAKTGKWGARIKVNGRYQHLGIYETREEAAAAYARAASVLHGEFARVA